nr:hypothetical protein [uncultured bacterium]
MVLKQLKDEHGSTIAYYAAFVITCLKAKQVSDSAPTKYDPTLNDLKDFTFFTVAKDNPAALALFERLLLCYKRDRFAETQVHLRTPSAEEISAHAAKSADAGSGV